MTEGEKESTDQVTHHHQRKQVSGQSEILFDFINVNKFQDCPNYEITKVLILALKITTIIIPVVNYICFLGLP